MRFGPEPVYVLVVILVIIGMSSSPIPTVDFELGFLIEDGDGSRSE